MNLQMQTRYPCKVKQDKVKLGKILFYMRIFQDNKVIACLGIENNSGWKLMKVPPLPNSQTMSFICDVYLANRDVA